MKKLQLSPILTLLIILVRISSGQQSVNLRDTIKVASEPDYPPYCIVDKEGNATGFSVDLFKEAAKAAGLNVSIKIGIWDKIKNDLAIGELDALPLVGRTPEREKDYDFTFPYITLHGAIFIRDGFTQIKSVDDLKNISVAVMKGDNAEEYLRRNKVTDKIITTNTFSEAFTKLISGEVNAVVMQRVTGIKLLEELNIKSIKPLDIQIGDFRQDFCFAVKKGDAALLKKLNEGLSIVIANKKYDEIHLKWFGPQIQEELSVYDVFYIH